jgi:hypothetical protein
MSLPQSDTRTHPRRDEPKCPRGDVLRFPAPPPPLPTAGIEVSNRAIRIFLSPNILGYAIMLTNATVFAWLH